MVPSLYIYVIFQYITIYTMCIVYVYLTISINHRWMNQYVHDVMVALLCRLLWEQRSSRHPLTTSAPTSQLNFGTYYRYIPHDSIILAGCVVGTNNHRFNRNNDDSMMYNERWDNNGRWMRPASDANVVYGVVHARVSISLINDVIHGTNHIWPYDGTWCNKV